VGWWLGCSGGSFMGYVIETSIGAYIRVTTKTTMVVPLGVTLVKIL
jgi:hypothetical protein